MNFILRTCITAVAIGMAFYVVPGFRIESNVWETIAVLAIIMGLVNATVKPILKFLTCPLILLTLGFGVLIINTLMFMLSANIADFFGYSVTVSGFAAAFMAALVVSIVNVVLIRLIEDKED